MGNFPETGRTTGPDEPGKRCIWRVRERLFCVQADGRLLIADFFEAMAASQKTTSQPHRAEQSTSPA